MDRHADKGRLRSDFRWRPLCAVILVCFSMDPTKALPATSAPGPLSRKAALEIRKEALLAPQGSIGRPLPLVSHWNMGSYGKGWTPQYQVQLLEKGYHILPWMSWPQGNPDADEKNSNKFYSYYETLIRYCRELSLPISFRGTQWEAMLVKERYRELPSEQCPAVITVEGKVLAKLSPFAPVEAWRDPAKEYVDTPAMKQIQQMYPNPPLVLFVSNNEAPDLRWHQTEQSKRYLQKYGKGRSDKFKRRIVSEGWMKLYPIMFQAMREALVSDTWKKNVRFVGYGAFGPSHFGRWDGWKEYSLITDKWTSPNWHIWDGGSPSYYTHNWCPNRDHWVWSTQVQSMNWIFQLEEAWQVNPDFWWEVSLWDGNSGWTPGMGYQSDLLTKSKACQYMKEGQTYTPDRYEGWAQFGLWLLRPRVIREFRGSTVPLEPWRPFFERLLTVVERIYNPTLEQFWRNGRLVPNHAHQHPYQANIPIKYRDINRWFLLDTNLDAARPWNYQTNIPVFSLAIVLGDKGRRRWLVYGHSPLMDRSNVTITVPEYGEITMDIPRNGAFYIIDEQKRTVKPLIKAS